jgi:hypothetical protein
MILHFCSRWRATIAWLVLISVVGIIQWVSAWVA